jgi:hypothetical protein
MHSPATLIRQGISFASDPHSPATRIRQRRAFASASHSPATLIRQRHAVASDTQPQATRSLERHALASDTTPPVTLTPESILKAIATDLARSASAGGLGGRHAPLFGFWCANQTRSLGLPPPATLTPRATRTREQHSLPANPKPPETVTPEQSGASSYIHPRTNRNPRPSIFAKTLGTPRGFRRSAPSATI